MDGKLRNMTSVYLTGEKGILCLYRIGSRVANRKFVGACGGHFEPEELSSPYACALREMREELGLTESDVEDIRLRYVTLRLYNGEIRQNYYFFGKLMTRRPLSSAEGELHWFTWEELKTVDMPLSARQMMDHYLTVGRFDENLYAGITEPGGARFVRMESFD